jgi:hypothetical protein
MKKSYHRQKKKILDKKSKNEITKMRLSESGTGCETFPKANLEPDPE